MHVQETSTVHELEGLRKKIGGWSVNTCQELET
jgi:hypothetical protein